MPEILGKYYTRNENNDGEDEVTVQEEQIDWDPNLSWAEGEDTGDLINTTFQLNTDPVTSRICVTDPNQPSTSKILYCLCQQEDDKSTPMIACDSGNCHIEWYHLPCVGLTQIPERQWICPRCSINK